MKRNTIFYNIVQCLFTLLALVGLCAVTHALGHLFRVNSLPFLIVWLVLPVFAVALNLPAIADGFTLNQLKIAKNISMGLAITLSILIGFQSDYSRNYFGKLFVSGYTHHITEEFNDDDEYYPDEWDASTFQGRLSIHVFDWLLLAAILSLPLFTWEASTRAYYKAEHERQTPSP